MKGPPCTALVAASGDPGAGTAFHEFGHFVNATLFRETRLFIIETLTLKSYCMDKNLLLSKYSNTLKLNNRIDSII